MRKMKRMREIKRMMMTRRRRRKRRRRRRKRKRRRRKRKRRRRKRRRRKRRRSRTRRRTWEKEVPVLLRICAFCSLPLFNQGDACVVQVYGSDGVCVSSF